MTVLSVYVSAFVPQVGDLLGGLVRVLESRVVVWPAEIQANYDANGSPVFDGPVRAAAVECAVRLELPGSVPYIKLEGRIE